MPKAIHARQGNSLAIGRHVVPGRVPCEIQGKACDNGVIELFEGDHLDNMADAIEKL